MAATLKPRHIAVALSLLAAHLALADPAPFDLVGPTLVVRVTRGSATLPITEVPNLAVGDRLLIKFELPTRQSANYLMVAAFLQGPTNPPPASWFYRCDTWTKSCIQNGLALTVPPDAEQLLIFFAPETGGDFKTLVSAVQGRPGAFVRAAQSLNQAALDRSRLDQYLSALRELESRDPGKVKESAPLLARSLAIKVDEKCLDRIPELQAPCLMQGQESLILSDGHSASMVATLTSGPASDLAIQAGNTSMMSSGAYLPYIGSILDIARLMDSFHTAKYQYIPALTLRRDNKLTLMLNTPPSFHDPRSVLVAALQTIGPTKPPPLHNLDAKNIYCISKNPLVFAVDGAPLVFATRFAHDMTIEMIGRDGKRAALPTHPDAKLGGFVIDTSPVSAFEVDDKHNAALKGYWGFDKFDGPDFPLARSETQPWAVAPGDESALVVGREDTLHLLGGRATCLENVHIRDAGGVETDLPWKAVKPDRIEVKVPLTDAPPGERTLDIKQYGLSQPQSLRISAFAAASRLDGFIFYAGDSEGTLKGTRLDQVDSLTFRAVEFAPGALSTTSGTDVLRMAARDAQAAVGLNGGDAGKATVKLKDGRVLMLDEVVASARPRGVLIARNIQRATTGTANIELGSADELPADAKLTFSVRTQSPTTYSRDEAIEVAGTDGSFSTSLSVRHGGLTLANSRVAIATLDPAAAFGSSAFGPLQFRLIVNGVAGDWQPLGVLVRLPEVDEVTCPADPKGSCQLKGLSLYLIDSLAMTQQFDSPVQVADGFAADELTIPHPVDGRVFLKLRDNPAVINTAVPRTSNLTGTADAPAPMAGMTPSQMPQIPATAPVAEPAPKIAVSD